jgi:hypothetical protein
MEDSVKAVKNQKVFITLDSYQQLIREYERVKEAVIKARAEGRAASITNLTVRKQAFEFFFNTTHLPAD